MAARYIVQQLDGPRHDWQGLAVVVVGEAEELAAVGAIGPD